MRRDLHAEWFRAPTRLKATFVKGIEIDLSVLFRCKGITADGHCSNRITVNAKGVPNPAMNSPRIDLAMRIIIMAVMLMFLPSLVYGETLRPKLAQRVAAFDSTNPLPFGQLVELAQVFHIPLEATYGFNQRLTHPC